MKTYKTLVSEAAPILIGTSPSLEMMKDMLKKYFYGGEYEFVQIKDKPETYQIKNTTKNKIIADALIVKKGNRYRFEFTAE